MRRIHIVAYIPCQAMAFLDRLGIKEIIAIGLDIHLGLYPKRLGVSNLKIYTDIP